MPWKDAFSNASCNKKEGSITIEFQSYFDDGDIIALYNYLNVINVEYSVDGTVFTPLLTGNMDFQGRQKKVWAKITKKNEFSQFSFSEKHTVKKKGSSYLVEMVMEPTEYWNHRKQLKEGQIAILKVKWIVPVNIKSIKSVLMTGKWCEYAKEKTHTETFSKSFIMDFARPHKKARLKTNNNVKVTGRGDIISVTGVNSGENIKVYNADTKAEIKSVIAHDNVVNIRLPKGNFYIVQVGQTSKKVSL